VFEISCAWPSGVVWVPLVAARSAYQGSCRSLRRLNSARTYDVAARGPGRAAIGACAPALRVGPRRRSAKPSAPLSAPPAAGWLHPRTLELELAGLGVAIMTETAMVRRSARPGQGLGVQCSLRKA
jgi:hypothetical protein